MEELQNDPGAHTTNDASKELETNSKSELESKLDPAENPAHEDIFNLNSIYNEDCYLNKKSQKRARSRSKSKSSSSRSWSSTSSSSSSSSSRKSRKSSHSYTSYSSSSSSSRTRYSNTSYTSSSVSNRDSRDRKFRRSNSYKRKSDSRRRTRTRSRNRRTRSRSSSRDRFHRGYKSSRYDNSFNRRFRNDRDSYSSKNFKKYLSKSYEHDNRRFSRSRSKTPIRNRTNRFNRSNINRAQDYPYTSVQDNTRIDNFSNSQKFNSYNKSYNDSNYYYYYYYYSSNYPETNPEDYPPYDPSIIYSTYYNHPHSSYNTYFMNEQRTRTIKTPPLPEIPSDTSPDNQPIPTTCSQMSKNVDNGRSNQTANYSNLVQIKIDSNSPVKQEKLETLSVPLNQCQEISSSTSTEINKIEKIDLAADQAKIQEENLVELKTKLKQKLKQELFLKDEIQINCISDAKYANDEINHDENGIEEDQSVESDKEASQNLETTNAASSESEEQNEDDDEEDDDEDDDDEDDDDEDEGKRSKSHRHRHHRHGKHRHHRHHHHHRRSKEYKEKQKQKRRKQKSKDKAKKVSEDKVKSAFEDDEEDEMNLNIRRSDRIRTIEAKIQSDKEKKIAEKIKNLNQNGNINENYDNESGPELHDENSASSSGSPSNTHKTIIDDVPDDTKPQQNAIKLDEINFPKIFERIDENIYLCKKREKRLKFNKEAKRMICDCSTSKQERLMGIPACGEDCINRLLMIECNTSRCPCGEHCTNQNFRTKSNASIMPFKTELKGWGLKTLSELKANSFLIEYVGEVIGLKEFKKRCERYAEQNNEHFYFMSLHNDLFIDATRKGNISRFFNHSCDPNCETQKWTVNGELRIGFFTRRPVQSNEELTFDYQFQTVGKKQQKCYCGSEKCRGYLGASSNSATNISINGNGALDHMWEDSSDSSEYDSEEPDDEDSKSQKISKKKNSNKSKRNKDKREKKSARNSTNSINNSDINRQISSIRNLSNKENVLKLCQLMFRTENTDSRIVILNLLLLNTNSEASLRLFMDYHGLKLLWSWMIDLDESKSVSINDIECKLKILDVLSLMKIKNRTVLEECKLLTTVKKWSEQSKYDHISESRDNDKEPDPVESTDQVESSKEEMVSWMKNLLYNLVDNSVKISHNKEKYSLKEALIEKATSLYDEWINLKQAFRIPKKQRVEERKEHERELNSESNTLGAPTSDYSQSLMSHASLANMDYRNANFDERSSYHDRVFKYRNPNENELYGSSYRNNFSKRFRYFYHKNNYHGFENYNNYYQQQQSLTKEERRQLFEQRVKEQERLAAEAAAAAAAAEAEVNASNTTNNITREVKWVYDPQTKQWVENFVPVSQSLPLSQPVVPGMMPPPPPPLPVPPSTSITSPSEQLDKSLATTLSALPNIQQHINNVMLSESNFADLKQAVKLFLPNETLVKPSPASPLRKIQTEVKPKSNVKNTAKSASSSSSMSLSAIAARLPPFWKCKKNSKGIIYYYNIKTKKNQWHFPRAKPSNSSTQNNSSSISKIDSPPIEKKPEEVESAAETKIISSTTPEDPVDKETAKMEVATAEPSSSADPVVNSSDSTATSDSFKICKDQFREKLSRMIIKLLQPYLAKDCKVGRIHNTDDFKHLARKFTHTIMEKEMSRATKIEELDLNKRIRVKTEDYVSRYMLKFTSGYSRKIDKQP